MWQNILGAFNSPLGAMIGTSTLMAAIIYNEGVRAEAVRVVNQVLGVVAGAFGCFLGSDKSDNNNSQNQSDNSGNTGDPNTNFTQGTGKAPPRGQPNSIYEQINNKGALRSRTMYNSEGRPEIRLDFDHPHGNYSGPHQHNFTYNENGFRIGDTITDILP